MTDQAPSPPGGDGLWKTLVLAAERRPELQPFFALVACLSFLALLTQTIVFCRDKLAALIVLGLVAFLGFVISSILLWVYFDRMSRQDRAARRLQKFIKDHLDDPSHHLEAYNSDQQERITLEEYIARMRTLLPEHFYDVARRHRGKSKRHAPLIDLSPTEYRLKWKTLERELYG